MRVIAIDGPAGSGKSTVVRALAAHLGLRLDTGAMYRCCFAVLRSGGDPEDAAALRQPPAGLISTSGSMPSSSMALMRPSRFVGQRSAALSVWWQPIRRSARNLSRGNESGRIGTVVACWRGVTSAPLSSGCGTEGGFTADPEERARRRAKEVTDLDYETVADIVAEMQRHLTSDRSAGRSSRCHRGRHNRTRYRSGGGSHHHTVRCQHRPDL